MGGLLCLRSTSPFPTEHVSLSYRARLLILQSIAPYLNTMPRNSEQEKQGEQYTFRPSHVGTRRAAFFLEGGDYTGCSLLYGQTREGCALFCYMI